jgi:hypothetical protein
VRTLPKGPYSVVAGQIVLADGMLWHDAWHLFMYECQHNSCEALRASCEALRASCEALRASCEALRATGNWVELNKGEVTVAWLAAKPISML